MNNALSFIVGVVLIACVGGFVLWQKSQETTIQQTETTDTQIGDMSVSSGSINPASMGGTEDEDEDEGGDDSIAGEGQPATTGTNTGGTSAGGITTAMIAQHNTRASCWSSINGNVYDLTSWIPNHPGGEQAILQLCGTDGSAKFNGKHGGAAKQAGILAGFKIGFLAN